MVGCCARGDLSFSPSLQRRWNEDGGIFSQRRDNNEIMAQDAGNVGSSLVGYLTDCSRARSLRWRTCRASLEPERNELVHQLIIGTLLEDSLEFVPAAGLPVSVDLVSIPTRNRGEMTYLSNIEFVPCQVSKTVMILPVTLSRQSRSSRYLL